MDRDGHSSTLEREHELSENQEKLHRLRQEGVDKEDASGTHKELGQRTVQFQPDPHFRSEGVEGTEGMHDIEKVVIGRKASKKHKIK